MKRLATYFLVPGILIGVALLQQYRAYAYHQSSWIGCGFGMFATLDNHTSRFVQARRTGSSPSSSLAIPDHLQPLVTRVCVVPTQAHLDQLAAAMHQQLEADAGDGQSQLEVSLYHIQLDPQTNYLSSQKWRHSTIDE